RSLFPSFVGRSQGLVRGKQEVSKTGGPSASEFGTSGQSTHTNWKRKRIITNHYARATGIRIRGTDNLQVVGVTTDGGAFEPPGVVGFDTGPPGVSGVWSIMVEEEERTAAAAAAAGVEDEEDEEEGANPILTLFSASTHPRFSSQTHGSNRRRRWSDSY
ncbi:hypothetical protein FRC20_009291, partial [Serendipita sp. 405]